ncbi:xanthine phosphoribosyltransferase [Deinobacterium chartae]|uniref:Xanthine phosphoribosyltransferase n=1 Tax=Deinobacterium chartae TaxID=521158 RepID=A0A841HWR5_9DEIO|nr:xanthine phosphoribosyltransferase [Deinobacterium chartae]MBB6096650.1 xanthine phosphoribosyltransferase [Deinobacterium chartae]
MNELAERIRLEGQVLPGGILKVDGFVNHQLDPRLTLEAGQAFARRFRAAGVSDVTRVLTAEVSGIAPALATAAALGVPVVYARKKRPLTMTGAVYSARAVSRTKGGEVELSVSADYLRPGERVLIIDDFLASGKTLLALAEIVRAAGAQLVGVGCLIEKAFEDGRARLAPLGVPVLSLAVIERMDEATLEVRPG